MSKFHRVALFAFALALVLGTGAALTDDVLAPVRADDEKGPPAADAPKKDDAGKKDAEPPKDDGSSKGDAGKEDGKKDDGGKKDGDEGKDGDAGKPDDKPKKGHQTEPDAKPADLPPVPKQPVDPGAPAMPESTWPPLPEGVKAGPAGTVFLPGAMVVIGTKERTLAKLLLGRPKEQRRLFDHERPQFRRYMEPFYLGRYELTNARYRRFLDDHMREHDTSTGGLATIDGIVKAKWSVSDKERKSIKYKLWRQFYEENKTVIWDAFKKSGQFEKLVQRHGNGKIDEEMTARKLRYEPLPRGIKLAYLSPMRPPSEWKTYHPPADELDHPVRGVTYNDFERFGVWAGQHVQTEFEYEYGARGATGLEFPWGEGFPLTAERVNWGSKYVKAFNATTVPVHALPAGQSPCGAFNTIGNVAEWTSSWFENYPGYVFKGKPGEENKFLGRYIKTLRGGAAPDRELLVLRPNYRNFEGDSAKGPPYPRNSYPWVGARMASYVESGRDQLGPITRHVIRYKKLKEHHLDLENFKGTVSNNWTEPGAIVANHVYVLGPSAAVVFVPTKSLLVPDRSLALQEMYEKSRTMRRNSNFLKRSGSESPEFVLGVLHTDVPLSKVLIAAPKEKDGDDKKKKKKKRRRRRRTSGPETVVGDLPAGTYILTFWHRQLCLMSESLAFKCFLPKYPGQKWQAEIQKVKPEDRMATELSIDVDLDEGVLKAQIDLGGKKPDEKYCVAIDALLTLETGALQSAGNGTWLQNPRPPRPDETEDQAVEDDQPDKDDDAKKSDGDAKEDADPKKDGDAKKDADPKKDGDTKAK